MILPDFEPVKRKVNLLRKSTTDKKRTNKTKLNGKSCNKTFE